MKILKLTLLLLVSTLSLQARNIHVSPSGSNRNKGTAESPFKTISKAALVALAGDSIIIHKGTYRERVSPANGGFTPQSRITYIAAPGERVELKGSDVVTGWQKFSDNVWSVVVPNTHFGEFNPYSTNLFGDWLHKGKERCLGEVYLDGKALLEEPRPKDRDKKQLVAGTWNVEVDDSKTTIYANFGGKNPNKSLTEINVRPTCFTPHTVGINYITIDGLNISHAATQWSPPTGEQVGMVNPNWSLGWIIQNCDISYSKCVGVCIGKERSTGHNRSALYGGKVSPFNKSGFSREIESIISAVNRGWCRENIGSHLIENNKIYECGQAGIVGHLGCIFSTIRGNEIYNANNVEYMGGFETGGIKLHAAIDVVIESNVITDCQRGLWLDWQAQGTQVVGNIFARNISEDLFIEVSHGPTLVYNNIMLSTIGIFYDAQGLMIANNLIYGKMKHRASQERYTPYHEPHSTQLRGFFNNAGGDAHFYNNLILAKVTEEDGSIKDCGLNVYDAYSTTYDSPKTKGKMQNNVGFRHPISLYGNVYYKGGTPHCEETNHTVLNIEAPEMELMQDDKGYYLSNNIDLKALKGAKSIGVNTAMLGITAISEQIYENRDLTPFVLATDIYGESRNVDAPMVGPFESAPKKYIWRR